MGELVVELVEPCDGVLRLPLFALQLFDDFIVIPLLLLVCLDVFLEVLALEVELGLLMLVS